MVALTDCGSTFDLGLRTASSGPASFAEALASNGLPKLPAQNRVKQPAIGQHWPQRPRHLGRDKFEHFGRQGSASSTGIWCSSSRVSARASLPTSVCLGGIDE